GEGYFPANSKPAVSSKVTRDQEGHIVVDLAGTTDEGDGSDMVLEKLGISAGGGLTFVPVPGQPGKWRSADPSNLGSFNLSVAGLSEGVTDDTTALDVNVPPKPEISNLAIDCSSTNGFCLSQGINYPVIFSITNATDCSVTPSLISGDGPPGTNGPVIINGINASSVHTTGPWAGDTIELKADCNGPGGSATPQAIQFTLE
ncbi:hypothetical protein KJ662_01535, partial [Patescibacteria group bacterium]|nr:hypothetical protein [Patescibacteria group bacterium]MBU1684914.1 hypothetical protein [Patescibacteria group bacterium]MBU1938358.1 hypothetical protein [Patescibacteria group bacterium]